MMGGEIIDALGGLRPRGKDPNSVSVLSRWVAEAEREVGDGRSGRLAWLVASVVATAKLQQVVDDLGQPLFVLKGGSLLQHRLGLASRPTKDVDGIVRDDIDEFVARLDERMREGWGAVGFSRSEVREIRVPGKRVNPRQFDLALTLRNRTWRRVTVEISPDEGEAGAHTEGLAAPSLAGFGLPTPDGLVGLAMSYQVAQKMHAASGPHEPPEYVNRRPRDVVDILLIRDLAEETGSPADADVRAALADIYAARAAEAEAAGRVPQGMPPRIVAYPHWESDYEAAASAVGMELSLEEAVAQANGWIGRICGLSDE